MGTGGVFLRKVRARVSDRPTGFLWIDDNKVAASGYPASGRQLEWVAKGGINTVLTLTEDPLPSGWAEGLNLSLKHVPMRDHEPPSMESLEKAASIVQAEVHAGRKVLVHCLAGQGRTMCVLAVYLIKDKGTEPETAIRMLRAMRPGAVESKQEKAVFDYAGLVRSSS